MALPNPGMDFTAFDILTAAEMDDLVENIESLTTGVGLNTASITPDKLNYSLLDLSTEKITAYYSGKPVYEKFISTTTSIINGSTLIPHGISSLGTMVSINATASLSKNTEYQTVPYVEAGGVVVALSYTPTDIKITSNTPAYTGSTPFRVHLRYTKV